MLHVAPVALPFLVGISCAALAFPIGRIAPLARPTTGIRGAHRKASLRSNGLFRLVEPLILHVGGWLRRAAERSHSLHRWMDTREAALVRAGRPAGLDVPEFIALSLLLAALFAGLAWLHATITRGSTAFVLPAFIFGGATPALKLQSITALRFKCATRELPAAIDVAALCMSAGMDFSGALRRVVDGGNDLVTQELGRVLQATEMGHTRRAALEELAVRLPVEPVREFVRAVIQAEERGNPVAEALRNQARMSRMRRSVAAEEAAARAGVLMMVPLMLLLTCIVLLLLGPFIVSGGGV